MVGYGIQDGMDMSTGSTAGTVLGTWKQVSLRATLDCRTSPAPLESVRGLCPEVLTIHTPVSMAVSKENCVPW